MLNQQLVQEKIIDYCKEEDEDDGNNPWTERKFNNVYYLQKRRYVRRFAEGRLHHSLLQQHRKMGFRFRRTSWQNVS